MSESNLLQSIRLACSRGAVRLHRNNQGRLQDARGRWVSFGVGQPGGSDLIGYRSVTITPEMVGQTLAQFVALECKIGRNRLTAEQANFLRAVSDAGGIAAEVRSVEDAEAALRQTLTSTARLTVPAK